MNDKVIHLGIIMDGNRRWARSKKRPAFFGHKAGAKKAMEVIKWCAKRGIKHLTLYAFSTENWKRSKVEIRFLFHLIERFLTDNLKEFEKVGGKIKFQGDRNSLPERLKRAMEKSEAATKNNNKITVNILLNYGGRADIVQAAQEIVREGISARAITWDPRKASGGTKYFGNYLWSNGTPDPDLVIRTSGEMRLSNFLIWQAAYAELVFCKKYWPEFAKEDLDAALNEYRKRQRRVGR